jgi:hypothetical protein
MTRTPAVLCLLVPVLLMGCLDDGEGGVFKDDDPDVEGNFEVNHNAPLQIYYNDALLESVDPGTGAMVDIDGQTLDIDSLCGTGQITCHTDAQWATLAVQMPYGFDVGIFNVIQLDEALPRVGTRLGGLYEAGTFEAFLGEHHIEDTGCDNAITRSLYGEFNDDFSVIKKGVLMTAFDAGCTVGGVTLEQELRIESTFRAPRLSELDLSDIEDEDEGPVDVEGDPIN